MTTFILKIDRVHTLLFIQRPERMAAGLMCKHYYCKTRIASRMGSEKVIEVRG